jgi:hypothetical protein
MLYDKRWDKVVETPLLVPLLPWQEFLLKAADLLEEKGWTQGSYWLKSGEMCLMGAMGRTLDKDRTTYGGEPSVMAEQKLTALTGGYGIVGWNDKVCQSKAQAVQLLRDAAKGE